MVCCSSTTVRSFGKRSNTPIWKNVPKACCTPWPAKMSLALPSSAQKATRPAVGVEPCGDVERLPVELLLGERDAGDAGQAERRLDDLGHDPSGAVRVMVATKPVDFRKGIDGFAALGRKSSRPIRSPASFMCSEPSEPTA